MSPPYEKSDLWTWNGATLTWTLVTPASPAPARTNAFGFVYDPARRKLVLWGGMEPNTYNPMADVWEWDATGAGTWNERTPSAGALPARESFAAYYDPVRGAPTMFGGGGNFWDAYKQDIWEWLPGTQARSAFVWTVPWTASGERSATFLALDVTASAAARGSDTAYPPSPVSGAALLGWDHLRGSWSALAFNSAGLTPATVGYTTADPVSVARILPSPSLSATIAVAPAALNQKGTALSRVALDYLELGVTYRRVP